MAPTYRECRQLRLLPSTCDDGFFWPSRFRCVSWGSPLAGVRRLFAQGGSLRGIFWRYNGLDTGTLPAEGPREGPLFFFTEPLFCGGGCLAGSCFRFGSVRACQCGGLAALRRGRSWGMMEV